MHIIENFSIFNKKEPEWNEVNYYQIAKLFRQEKNSNFLIISLSKLWKKYMCVFVKLLEQ